MTTTLLTADSTAPVTVEATPRTTRESPGANWSVPIPHDFPFPICSVCRFPIPPQDAGGSEFQPRHASTCAEDTPRERDTHPTRKEFDR